MRDPLNVALHYLKFRPRTQNEIRKRLQVGRYPEKVIDNVISVLKKNKLLDDREFAKMYVRDRNLLKPTGAYLLKMELRKLGVADGIIERALSEQDEEELARKALEQKYRGRDIEYEKKVSFLQRRGFRTSIIFKVLKEDL